ncbi:coiled-coil domain-containing protein 137 [Copidosoma floridanum]|uniref:coiled-coil domain-containing protein 137 n=1 Tax=Copidosoma floridanum TaxID=29053 RepID=UPI0006C9A1FF|nr:coiled-coil domain-containing protein 137 [Copidosoma floridanum]
MGRKIPGKKHRGVKDPEKQRAKRISELQTKINAPPKNVDEQEIPRSLQRLMKLKKAVEDNKFEHKKRKRNKNKLIRIGAGQIRKPHPKARPEKIVPIFNQRPDESPEKFYHRISRETEAFVKETQFETKYNVDVKRNPETGEIKGVDKRFKDNIDKIEDLKKKHKNVGKRKKLTDADGHPKLTKAQKKKQKVLEKKQEDEEILDFDRFKDKVEFGDIVHAPPELKLPRNVNKINNKVSIAEKNKNLLLNSLLQENQSLKNHSITKPINRTGKRKNLPIGERRQLEKQQKDVVSAYRQLKAKKFGESVVTA